MSWKVRTMPARAMACGGFPVISAPSRKVRPEPAEIAPAMRLNTVVLPAPFGPMMPRMLPSSTSKLDVVDRRHATEPLGEALDPKDAHERNHLSRMAL